MTFVVELRDLKKILPRPVTHFWQRAARGLCSLPVRLALLGLCGLVVVHPFDGRVTPSGGVLALLCGVLSAAVSATLGLLFDAGIGVYALFSHDASPMFRLGQRLSLCFGEQAFPFDICGAAGPFPLFSRLSALALVIGALLLFGCGFRRHESPWLGGER